MHHVSGFELDGVFGADCVGIIVELLPTGCRFDGIS